MSVQRRIVYYRDPATGKEPVLFWIDSIRDKLGKSKIFTQIDRVSQGNFGNTKSLGDGLFEIKINFGPGYRIYFALEGQNIILLLFGGPKTSQGRDIMTARSYLDKQKTEK